VIEKWHPRAFLPAPTAAAPPRSWPRRALAALRRGWLRFAEILAWINTRLLLGAVFLLLFVPARLVLRLAGRDPLARRLEPDAPTYWRLRGPQERQRPPSDYEKQY
jgi:hypothetical protein